MDISAYADEGVWAGRRGFDSVVQCTSGMFKEQYQWTKQKDGFLPVQALDHLTGLLGALAVIHCLERRAQEGGSYRIRLSLERTAFWLQSMSRRKERILGGLEEIHTRWLKRLSHSVRLSDGKVLGTILNPIQIKGRLPSPPEAVVGQKAFAWLISKL